MFLNTGKKQLSFLIPIFAVFLVLSLVAFLGCITSAPICGNDVCEQFSLDRNELDKSSISYCPADCGIINPIDLNTSDGNSVVQIQSVNSFDGNYFVLDLTTADINILSKAKADLVAVRKLNSNYQLKYARTKSTVDNKAVADQEALVKADEQNVDALLKRYGIPDEIDNEIDSINEKAVTWTANYNPVFFKTDDYKKRLTGLLLPQASSNQKSAKAAKWAGANDIARYPDFFDWRDIGGKNYITPIKDQGGCGSCWAFSSIGAVEGETQAYYNNPFLTVSSGLNLNLSEQDLVSCSGAGTCDGGYVGNVLSYISGGVAHESCFPYTATNNDCKNKCANWQANKWGISSNSLVELGNINAIKNALITKGPLVTGMMVYSDFFTYTSGIYSHQTGDFMGYHAISIVGYGTYDDRAYWICKNSWGTSWGENGYFRIFAGDDTGIDSLLLYSIDAPVPSNVQQKICTDTDLDGHCYWGLGEKPSTCPFCDSTKDCDDSNASINQGCGATKDAIGQVSVSTNPIGAEVYTNALDATGHVHRGQSPLDFNLNVGQRTILIHKDGHRDEVIPVSVEQGKIAIVNSTLFILPKISSPLDSDIYRAGDSITIIGTIATQGFKSYTLEYGVGINPKVWVTTGITLAGSGANPITNSSIATWDTTALDTNYYTLRVMETLADGNILQAYVKNIYLDSTLKKGWPVHVNYLIGPDAPAVQSNPESFIAVSQKEGADASGMVLLNDSTQISKYLTTKQGNGTTLYWGGWLFPVVADLFNDGNKEIIVLVYGYPPQLNVYRNDGTLLWSRSVGSGMMTSLQSSLPLVGDLDNDGKKEIVAINQDSFIPDYSDPNSYKSELIAYRPDGSILWDVNINPRVEHPTMAMADLDGDGAMEIVIEGNTANQKVLIVSNRGKILYDWNLGFTQLDSYAVSSPAIGKFDNSNQLGIVIASYSWIMNTSLNETKLYIYKMDGNIMKGWPITAPGLAMSSPVVGDIDKDGQQEILLGLVYFGGGYNPNYGGLYAYKMDGNVVPNWPVLGGFPVRATPALADLDGDGKLEIVISSDNATYVFNSNGSSLPHWGQLTAGYNYFSSAVGAIDSTNGLGVITPAGNGSAPNYFAGGVYAWGGKTGLVPPNFPKVTEVNADAPVVIDDIDNDGKLELIASSDLDMDSSSLKNRGSIYVWKLDSLYSESSLPWPTFMHDVRRTGWFGNLLCGNGVCDLDQGETNTNCSQDCIFNIYGPWVTQTQSNTVHVGNMAQFTSTYGNTRFNYFCEPDGNKMINPLCPNCQQQGTFYCVYSTPGLKTARIKNGSTTMAKKDFNVI